QGKGVTSDSPPPDPGDVINVGSGSGSLTFSQASTGAKAGNTIVIAPGVYSYISINNFDIPAGSKITITNGNGVVRLTEAMYIENIAGVDIVGNGSVNVSQGFQFIDIALRAIKMGTK